MLDYSIMRPQGILVLKPHDPLTKEDFQGLSTTVDAYLADHAILHGVLIEAKSFPGWESFGGFTAHMHFVGEHHQKIRRLALVTDSKISGFAESMAKHFTSAEVRHFAFGEDAQALAWLETP
jgi:hypothetical protein